MGERRTRCFAELVNRDFIIVVGNQGYGKSVWKRAYTKSKTRLLEYDPLASDPTIDFTTDANDWAASLIDGSKREFRYGTYFQDELPLYGSLAFAVGDCTFAVEECGTIFRRGATMDQWLSDLVFMGRHPRVNLILLAQRASSIPIDVRSQAQRIVTFLQTEPDDVDALCKRIGYDLADEILNLPMLTCIDKDLTTGEHSRYTITP